MTPAELSGIITHLAFYGGWGNGYAAARNAAALYDAASWPRACPPRRWICCH